MEIPLTEHVTYVCPECAETKKTYNQWLEHLNEIHEYKRRKHKEFNFQKISNDTYKCLDCKQRLVTGDTHSVLLQLHYVTHLPSAKVYRCVYCAFATAHQSEVSAHLKSIHHKELQNAVNKLNSDYRNAKFNPEFYMRFHCPLCNQIINRFESWLTHINKTHKTTSTELNIKKIGDSSNYFCMSCKRMFYTNDHTVLQRHRFTHLPYPEYCRCAYCATTKSTKIGILRHFIEEHRHIFDANRQYIKKPIEWGQVKSNNGNEFEKHVRYVCIECEAEFIKKENCRSHISRDHQFDMQKHFRRLKTNYYKCLKCKKNLMCKEVKELQKHYFSHVPYRSCLKCFHCGIMETNAEEIWDHLKDECPFMPLTNNNNEIRIPPPLNLYSQPYDYQEILKHLQKSQINILEMSKSN